MGPVAATAAAESLAEAGCGLLLSFGTAGALDASLDSGDLLLTTLCSAWPIEPDTASRPGAAPCPTTANASTARSDPCEPCRTEPPQGERPTAKGPRDVAPDGSPGRAAAQALLAALEAALAVNVGVRVRRQGHLVTIPQVIEGEAARLALARHSGAVAVDMESAAIAAVAQRRGLGFLAVRSIVDTLGCPLPQGLARHVDPWGRPRVGLALALLTRPGLLPALVGLARRMTRARRSLRACAECLRGADPNAPPTA